MELTPRLNGPPRLVGNALIVLCGYRGGARNKQTWRLNRRVVGRIVNALTLFGLRQFVATYRDHYANPRDLAYQVELARAVLASASFTACDVLVDTRLTTIADALDLQGVRQQLSAAVAEPDAFELGRYDTIVLIYPDAIGLSWTRMETRALAAATGTVVVANGRRRLFTLDPLARRQLKWRRFLANTRIVQLLLGVLVLPVGAVLAGYDALRGRS